MQQKIQSILDLADVKINGNRPWDIQINNDQLYSRVLSGGSLALGESYMDGWWECQALDQFFDKILSAELDKKVVNKLGLAWNIVKAKIINVQSKKRAFKVGEKHYDVGLAMICMRLCWTKE